MRDTDVDVLYEISSKISAQAEVGAVFGDIMRFVRQLTGADSCLLYMLDVTKTELVLTASSDPLLKEVGSVRLRIGEGTTGWVAQSGQTTAVSERAWADPRFKLFATLPQDRFEAFLSAPLIANQRTLGLINVQHREPHIHSDSEVKLLTVIGQQVGSAIESARLYTSAQKRSQQIETILRIGEFISGDPCLDDVLRLIADLAFDVTNCSVCSIMLVDEQKQELVIKAARSSSDEYVKKPSLNIANSLVGSVVRTRKMMIVPDVRLELAYCYPEMAKRAGLRSLVSVPLIAKDQVLGVINCYASGAHELSGEELRMLTMLAQQASFAVEKVRLSTEATEAREALQTRKVVERAKGILQSEARITEQEAYLRLQQQSRRIRKPIKEIAEAIILAGEMKNVNPRPTGFPP